MWDKIGETMNINEVNNIAWYMIDTIYLSFNHSSAILLQNLSIKKYRNINHTAAILVRIYETLLAVLEIKLQLQNKQQNIFNTLINSSFND